MDSYYTYGNTIRYTCNSGYKLIGNKSRYCNASAQWEGEEPECVGTSSALLILSVADFGLEIWGKVLTLALRFKSLILSFKSSA